MASPAGITVYNLPPSPPNLDAVGRFYLAFLATWTTLVFSGMGFLIWNRRSPILRVRGLGLSLTAILFLQAYWVLAQLTYPIGQTMPVLLAYDIQYFFMGIWFPLGIALFHASNLRFLHVAQKQKRYAQLGYQGRDGCNGSRTSWLCRLRNMSYTSRVMIFIGFGMVIQVLLTIGMWMACRKYHPTFGIPGTGLKTTTVPEQLAELGQGWEWWPQVIWQVVWSWIVAPILIWRSRGIKDTLGWRFQTIACCLSSLHATPMWLIASYVPAFGPINAYFAPSYWLHLSSMMFEIFTVFVPCWLVIRHKMMQRKVDLSRAKWDTLSQTTTLRGSMQVDSKWRSASVMEKGSTIDLLNEELGDRLLTMGALDHVLNDNPAPLQEFSAMRDFSGENIAFLTQVAAWQTSWPESPTQNEVRALFTRALGIYVDFISPHDADFPINLSSPDLKQLENLFEKTARILYGEARVNPATPFGAGSFSGSCQRGSDSDTGSSHGKSAGITSRVQYTGDISDEFDRSVFETAQQHIKYLVLTNTWPKFVRECQKDRQSIDSERSEDTKYSQASFASKVSSLIQSVSSRVR
ncbi:hypothetical protein F5Y15DRAFT_271396 [Xylariaceae sp. FL0016]|nr:hypothetical protein F5Y15DRAFT_271396 [Xylariaceae sp. FL0016]